MKTARKLFAGLLALAVLCSMCIGAFAAETKGSVTIQDSKDGTVADRTFNAYQILEASFVDQTDFSKGISYVIPEKMTSFYKTRYSLDPAAADFTEKVLEKISTEVNPFTFAREALAAAKTAGVTPVSATAGTGATTVTISNMPFGYYVIEDASDKKPVSSLVLDTVGNVTVTLKNEKPIIDKKADGASGNTAAVGDQVPFVLTTKVPEMSLYDGFVFIVNDTMSKGLTFNNDVAVKVGEKTLKKDTDFTVSQTPGTDGTTAVQIVFMNFIQYKNQKDAAIKITYSAIVNENAVIGNGGTQNEAELVYSNDPKAEFKGDTNTDGTTVTPGSVTKTFSTGLRLTKTDKDGKRLTGAKFKLEGDKLNTVLVQKDVFVKDEAGTYYLLKTGAYTTTPPEPGTEDQYAGTDTYKMTTKTETITKSGASVSYEGTVGADGTLTFAGLSAGDYTLTEVKAPEGYNILKTPIKLKITCQMPEEITGSATWSVDNAAAGVGADGVIQLTVVNNTGSELPSTGGIGTTIFYVVGGGLMLVAAVLLITRKRMGDEK